jgi:hypothetical protein
VLRSASTGPGTLEGLALARSRRADWKHGLYSAEVLAEPRRVRDLLSQSRDLLNQMQNGWTNGVTVQGVDSQVHDAGDTEVPG